MKLRIAVCDDEKAQTEYIAGLTRQWAAGKHIVDISSYDSAEAFLFAYEADKSVDILLLDIQMKNLDGISLARQLRRGGGKMQIVFITGIPDFIADGYEVSALHYLLKPVSPEKLYSVLDKALEHLDKPAESILAETEAGQVRIFHRDIHYAEAFAHTTALQTECGGVEVRMSIGALESMLGSAFCRAHRSYLVGLRHVRQITRAEVIMDSGKAIPISRRRYAEINMAFIRFYRGEA